ncbi:MAG: hypothetical protein JNM26_10460 [Ideonella sp.]|nr:hypothetical protein [Ideonella sp.]
MRVPDLLADLFAPAIRPAAGEIRPDSPAVRPGEIQQPCGFSPDSPRSPLPDPELFAPPEPVDKIRPDSPTVRPAETPATARVFALFAPFAPAEPRPDSPRSPAEPAAHCDRCGSPSWWHSPTSPTWRCAYCSPRPQPLPAGAECVTLFSGQWAPGCAPPAAIPVTVDGLLAIHGETVAGCRTLDVLELADDGDLPDFLADRAALEGFAAALVADRRIRPLPPADLPPLARIAAELGDEPGELRAWLDRTGPGRALRVRLEREHGACDRCLLALRDDPDGPLLPLLARALDGDRTAEPVPDDGRVQDGFGAWRAEIEHDAIRAFYRHHWRCTICQRAGRGYGDRCEAGERLHAATRAHT